MEILIIQTAFAGDLVLTTPLITACAEAMHGACIDVLCIPSTSGLLENNPHIRDLIVYDKRGGERLGAVMRTISRRSYDICLTPHRSMRSAILARSSRARIRVSFDRSSGGLLHTHRVVYDRGVHEVRRNLALLHALDIHPDPDTPPRLYPGSGDMETARAIVERLGNRPVICFAPGSVWATKRWTEEGFAGLAQKLLGTHSIVLLGGADDRLLCSRITARVSDARCISTAGDLPYLASAALLQMSGLLVSNDSAPVHIASAVSTPVVEIYGATSPEFGFTPFGVPHRIVQVEGLPCKPCGIHGSERCPKVHFACMRDLSVDTVYDAVMELVEKRVIDD
ncbi:MAG: glycosyltransferase family 9 protein [Proteobacteria bacterium]|nr:glycosyltransferase family 9 protein [Pseudomonadota bacterium]